MKNVVNVIKKPFITVAKFFSNIDWKNVKIEVWVRYLLMVLTLINGILTHFGKNPIPYSEDAVYQAVSDIITVIIFIVNTYKDNPTSSTAIESNEIQKAMKAAEDLTELREIFQTKLEEIDSRIEVQNEIVHDDMNEEDRIKSCSTKVFQKFNDINVPVVIMVTKNKKRLEKKYLDYDFDDYIIKPINKRSINFIMEKYLSLL